MYPFVHDKGAVPQWCSDAAVAATAGTKRVRPIVVMAILVTLRFTKLDKIISL